MHSHVPSIMEISVDVRHVFSNKGAQVRPRGQNRNGGWQLSSGAPMRSSFMPFACMFFLQTCALGAQLEGVFPVQMPPRQGL